VEWWINSITIWQFPRAEVPGDITANNPNPRTWKKPIAKFSGDCNFAKKFPNQTVAFNPF
jgi:hypothetical protein